MNRRISVFTLINCSLLNIFTNISGGIRMCEFSALVDGKIVFKDVIFARVEGNKVLLKDILGSVKTLKDYKIVEVNVNSEKLILSKL